MKPADSVANRSRCSSLNGRGVAIVCVLSVVRSGCPDTLTIAHGHRNALNPMLGHPNRLEYKFVNKHALQLIDSVIRPFVVSINI